MPRGRGFALLATTTAAATAAASILNNPAAIRSLCCRHRRSAASSAAFAVSPAFPTRRWLALVPRLGCHSTRAEACRLHARHRSCGDAAPPFGGRELFRPLVTRVTGTRATGTGTAGTSGMMLRGATSPSVEPGRGGTIAGGGGGIIVSISDSFDGGNIEHVDTTTATGTATTTVPTRKEECEEGAHDDLDGSRSTTTVRLRIKPDPFTELEKKHHSQYFSFRATFSPSVPPPSSSTPAAANNDAPSSTRVGGGDKGMSPRIRYVIENAGECSYAAAWAGTTVFASRDRRSWRRILATSYDPDAGRLSWTTDDGNEFGGRGGGSVYYAYFPPYPYERHLDLISRCAASGGATVRSLGQTLDGREVDCVTVGTGSTVAWVIHRQHPGETMAEYFAEGLLSRLLGLGVDTDGSIDGTARRARELFTFHIVPNMCPDGGVRGHLRTNACGANLNREWAPTTTTAAPKEGVGTEKEVYEAPTLRRSPEVYHVLAEMDRTGVDLFADCHGDEELPFNFLAGSEGCPNWGDRLRTLHGAFLASYCRANGDMQRDVSYDPDPPGGGNMAICSNQIGTRFDCLAFTLEMPFKDCLSNPDPERGWNPERARRLGASFVDAAVYVQQYLRCEGAFWESLPAEDAYVRPCAKY